MKNHQPIRISIVIPVYKGEFCLGKLIKEIEPLTGVQNTSEGSLFMVSEILLVHDCGPDNSDQTIEELISRYPFIKGVWLTRNYGQHAATLAGMASTNGDWVVTLDEDGQQDPCDIGNMLDVALNNSLQIVYARPTNIPPHGFIRNFFSSLAKKIALKLLGGEYQVGVFNSFRLINGEISRILASYCSNGIYLDIALFWIANRIGYCPVKLRNESRDSGYNCLMLINHFWRMILTAGTRPLRLITFSGIFSLFAAMGVLFYVLYSKLIAQTPVQGWASILIFISFFSGLIMVSLGLLAEYLALAVGIAMGKPLYMVSSQPTRRANFNMQ
ncbi:glycosyltransferase [Polynucleobacter sp. MWH-UH19D]|uniref:glycosyltransferase n=1 Tax=Polynucleobacter sp. MWH-UH19D TaxID=1855610 RepID=UPI003365035D